MAELWWRLGIGIIGGVLGLLGLAGLGIYASGRAFEKVIREIEDEDR